MPKLTPTEIQEKHARRLKGSLEDIKKGVERVTTAPGVAAGKKQGKMLANLTESITSGKWKRNVEGVSLEDWKGKMIDKGINRISGGIDAAKEKTIAFHAQIAPVIDAAQAKIKAMPDLTFEDNIARSAAFLREMHKFKKK